VGGITGAVTTAIALGSNRGDRRANIEYGFHRLVSLLQNPTLSPVFETAPVGVPGAQEMFLNAAAVGATAMPARELLDALLAIEQERGRERPFPGAARTLDLDLILYGPHVVSEPGLEVPHPRFRERRFVLEPLASVAPDMRDPVTHHSIRELLAALKE
jgi:2-amino-4-hydroxy-6-hydroxymethyldihydropteridine diphosphokinase